MLPSLTHRLPAWAPPRARCQLTYLLNKIVLHRVISFVWRGLVNESISHSNHMTWLPVKRRLCNRAEALRHHTDGSWVNIGIAAVNTDFVYCGFQSLQREDVLKWEGTPPSVWTRHLQVWYARLPVAPSGLKKKNSRVNLQFSSLDLRGIGNFCCF